MLSYIGILNGKEGKKMQEYWQVVGFLNSV